MICECGRTIAIRLHPGRNPRSTRKHTKHTFLEGHDLCRQCFKRLLYQARAEQDERDRQEARG